MDEDTEADRFFEELLHAVDQQIEAPKTAYVRNAFERLTSDGMEPDEAREAIARCLAEATDRMFRSQRPFDEDAYRTSLEMINPGD